MSRFLCRILLLLTLSLPGALPGAALAQSWPVYESVYVNDYAKVLDESAEERLTATLRSLREETGVEATVLTLYTRWGFESSGSFESFATGLFNHWGIGNAETNDGILILVVTEDREMRVELGAGYGTGYNGVAKAIIDRAFLPDFKLGDYQSGILTGTQAVIDEIARPFTAGIEAPSTGSSGGVIGAFFVMFIAPFLALIGFGIWGRRLIDRFSRCPQCGERGIHTEKTVLDRATRTSTGSGEKHVTCSHCGYDHRSTYVIPRVTSSSSGSGGSFGGGSSSGGGASGRW